MLFCLQVKDTCSDAGMEAACKIRESQNQGCTVVKGNGNGFSNYVYKGNCKKNTVWSPECQSIEYLFFNDRKNASDSWERKPASSIRKTYDNETGLYDWGPQTNNGLDFVSGQEGKLYHALCFTVHATTTTSTTSSTTTATSTNTAEMSSEEMRSKLHEKECITANTSTRTSDDNSGKKNQKSSLPHIDLFLNPGR